MGWRKRLPNIFSRDRAQRKPRYSRVPANEKISGYLFILPAFSLLLVFFFFPAIYSFYISLFNYDLFNHVVSFDGLANYIYVVAGASNKYSTINSALWWLSVFHALEYTAIVVPTQTFLAFFLALLFSTKTVIARVTRAVVFIPAVTSSAVMSTIFIWFYSPQGLLNYILSPFGVRPTNWLLSTTWAFPAIMALNVFTTAPYFMVVFIAGLRSIPQSINEAAAIDGLNVLQRVRYLYIPLLRFSFIFVIILGITGSMQVFDQIYFMSSGGPGTSTYTPLFYIWTAFENLSNLGIAAAASFILFLIIFALVVIQNRVIRETRWA